MMSVLSRMLSFGRNEHYEKGIRLYDREQYEEAVSEFALARGDGEGRRDKMTDRLALFYTAESYTHLGYVAMRVGNWERAQHYFGSALEIHPHYADLHYNLAVALRSGGQAEAAIESLEKALEINPRFAKAHFCAGLIRYSLGDYESGLSSLNAAIEIEPGFRTEEFARASAFDAEGNREQALCSFERVSLTAVDDILYHFKLGDDLMRRGLYDKAAEEYENALTLNPKYADIHNNLGVAYSALNRDQDAEAEFRTALQINPRYKDALTNLSVLLHDTGRAEEAESLFRTVLDMEHGGQDEESDGEADTGLKAA
jgi:tetratricopeptide (TPR) repeat protein